MIGSVTQTSRRGSMIGSLTQTSRTGSRLSRTNIKEGGENQTTSEWDSRVGLERTSVGLEWDSRVGLEWD